MNRCMEPNEQEHGGIVYVVVLDPQGSVGGFDWFYRREDAEAHADKIGRDLVLGVTEHSVSPRWTREEITDEIDAGLQDTERRLGYAPPNDWEEVSAGS